MQRVIGLETRKGQVIDSMPKSLICEFVVTCMPVMFVGVYGTMMTCCLVVSRTTVRSMWSVYIILASIFLSVYSLSIKLF